jgi:hypothetical protein
VPTLRRSSSRLAGAVLVLLLCGLAAFSIWSLQPPDAAPADAPADEFSAARAFEHVQRIADRTPPMGDATGNQVVDDLVGTLTGLGLDTRVQNAVGARGHGPGEAHMARVRNVVAVLPGSAPTGRLFLTAHHDSVATGPGATDAAAGASAMLEAVRALTEGPQLRNDVVVVLTDAGEACLCGAEAFAGSHPLASAGGVVLDFEARGTTGPPIMVQTSPGNADLAAVYARAAVHPVATSVAVEVDRALRHGTGFSVLLADGAFTGLSTAFFDGAAGHRTAQELPGRLDQRAVQAMGDNAVALTRALGDTDLAPLAQPSADDATYFPVLGELVRYPDRLVWPLAGAALAAVALLALVVHRRGLSSLRRTAVGAVLALAPLVLGPLAAQGLWALLVRLRPGYGEMLDPWRPGWYRLAVVAVVVTVVLVWYALLRRRVGPTTLAVGGLVWLAASAAVLAAYAPGGSYLAAWPALAGALAGMLVVVTSSPALRPAAFLLAGTVAVLVLAPTAALLFPALGLRTGAAPALVATLLALALLPAFELLFPQWEGERRGRTWMATAAVPTVAVVLAIACTGVGLSVDRFDADHPVPSQLVYALDADSGRAWWATREAEPGEYTARYVEGREQLPVEFPALAGPNVATGPAEVADLPAALVTTVSDDVVNGMRRITVRVEPQRPGVRLVVLDLSVDGGSIVRAQIAGRAVPEEALNRDFLEVSFSAPTAGGLQATYIVQGDGAVDLRVVDGSDGLAGLPGFRPRPEGVGAAGTDSTDVVFVSRTTPLG